MFPSGVPMSKKMKQELDTDGDQKDDGEEKVETKRKRRELFTSEAMNVLNAYDQLPDMVLLQLIHIL